MAAIVMMPLLVGLYAQGLDTNIQVPYAKIAATILIMLIPVIIGMTVRGKKPSAAKTLEKIGSYAGILIIVVLIGSFVSRERALLASTPATVYGGIALLCFGGFAIGYLGSLLAKLPRSAARTVALETGIQNTPLTMAVIVASFPAEDHTALLVLPLIYAVSIVIYACVMTGIFRAMNRAK
jgi:BASS family bile acid:Na+ symporter